MIEPLAEIPVAPPIAALPKADIHIHAEWSPRLDRVLAQRNGRQPHDWRDWVTELMKKPPGMPRLQHISSTFPAPEEADVSAENCMARLENLLTEAAADNAVLVEVRLGKDFEQRPDFMALFRKAERRTQTRFPNLRAEAIPVIFLSAEPRRLERMIQVCIRAADEGVSGVDFLYHPYHTEADWAHAYRVAERLADAGLGITIHAGEVSSANIAAALKTPGLTRLGHATYAGYDPRLLELVAESSVTVECSLTCNVVVGAAPSYEAHPIQQFIEAGVPVALCTDDPVQVCTTIGREYAIAHALGFTRDDLLNITRTAVRSAFTTPERRHDLLRELDDWAVNSPAKPPAAGR